MLVVNIFIINFDNKYLNKKKTIEKSDNIWVF